MGACNFSITVYGKDTDDAYKRAVKNSIKYRGDDPYNGTISTTRGVKLVEPPAKYGTKAFYEWEDKQLDKLSKWGHCISVEIKGSKTKSLKKDFGLAGKRGIKFFYMFGWAAE